MTHKLYIEWTNQTDNKTGLQVSCEIVKLCFNFRLYRAFVSWQSERQTRCKHKQ